MEILTNPLILVRNLYNSLSKNCDLVDKNFIKDMEDFKSKLIIFLYSMYCNK